MNSKLWIHKALSTCLVVAIIATYSMVALANGKVAGELLVTGSNINGETPVVTVNGESAKTGRSVFSSSTIATPENASAILNMGKIGKIQIAPNSVFTVTFNENGIKGDLTSGKVTVLGASSAVAVHTANGENVALAMGESATVAGKNQTKDDDDDSKGGAAWWWWGLIVVGAGAGIVYAATRDNELSLGGSSTVVSPNR